MAGGQSLIPLLRFRMARPASVVDIGRLSGLDGIEELDDGIRVGATATAATIARSPLVHSLCPLLAEAAAKIGDPLVRNAGTIGGNLAHAFPHNDLPAVVVAARATVIARGPGGPRSIAAADFFDGPLQTTLGTGELITHIDVPASPAGAYEKLKRGSTDYGVAGVAVQLIPGPDRTVAAAGIAVTGANRPGVRAVDAEEALVGTPSDDAIERAADAVGDAAEFADDTAGSDAYKSALVVVLARRAIRRALERAWGVRR